MNILDQWEKEAKSAVDHAIKHDLGYNKKNNDRILALISVLRIMEGALKWYSDAEEYPPKEFTQKYNTPHLQLISFDQGLRARETLSEAAKVLGDKE